MPWREKVGYTARFSADTNGFFTLDVVNATQLPALACRPVRHRCRLKKSASFANLFLCLENFFPTLEKIFSCLEKLFSSVGNFFSWLGIFPENNAGAAGCLLVAFVRVGKPLWTGLSVRDAVKKNAHRVKNNSRYVKIFLHGIYFDRAEA